MSSIHSAVHAIIRIDTKVGKVNDSCDEVARVLRRRRACSGNGWVDRPTKFGKLILEIGPLRRIEPLVDHLNVLRVEFGRLLAFVSSMSGQCSAEAIARFRVLKVDTLLLALARTVL